MGESEARAPEDRFDLHVHSSASDGSLSPAEVVREAARRGLAGFALTDHDTIEGLEEACEEALAQRLVLIPGVEISVSEESGARQMHILGLGIDPRSRALRERLQRMRGERLERALRMLGRLRGLGIEIPEEVVREAAARGSVGRPHLAGALVRLGVCRTYQEAFDRFIGHRGPAYIPRSGLGAAEAIAAIHESSGIAVLAHPPLSVGVAAPGGLEEFVARVARQGLDGVEADHPGHSPKERRRLARIARARDLLATGGSDFHGEARPGVEMGRGRGDLRVGGDVFRAVLSRIEGRRALHRGRPDSLTAPRGGGTLRRLP